jgi:hypothetical protein
MSHCLYLPRYWLKTKNDEQLLSLLILLPNKDYSIIALLAAARHSELS